MRQDHRAGAPQDLIVFSHLRWGFVWQRPQHLISRLAAGRRAWFVEEPLPADVSEARLQVERAGPLTKVWLEVPGEPGTHVNFDDPSAAGYIEMLGQLLDQESVGERLAWLYTPMALPFARRLDPELLIYDVMDDLNAFKNPPKALMQMQDEVLACADIVFAGGRSLFEQVSKRRQDPTYLFASGVEPEHYAAGRNAKAGAGPRVAGYVGVIDERLDHDLVGGLARALPEWEVRMVGPVLKIDPSSLPQAPNLKYLGQQPYEKLPEIMGGFDVALMPFALNEATRSISPTKTLEYMAVGLPIVSTRVPDVVADFSSAVHFEEEAGGFAAACRKIILEPAEERTSKAKPLLKLHHWDAIAGRMNELIEDCLASSGTPPSSGSGANGSRGIVRPETNGFAGNLGAERHGSSGLQRAEVNGSTGRVSAGDDRAFDYVIAGAGFAGSVLAERLATQAGKRVLLVEKRNHIGGNAFDFYDDAGILIHKYGPHIFHTNSRDVFDHLSQFTSWRQYEHRVMASVEGLLVPIPINLETINQLYGLSLTSLELEAFFSNLAEPVADPKTSEDVVVGKVGRELYEKFFRNYTRKQWGLDPSELDASVAGRVPVRVNRDCRYFTDRYQAMPLHGYTRMFQTMLSHPNIKVMLNTNIREVLGIIPFKKLIYTGPIDEYFDFRFGKLPYRSLEFKFETKDKEVVQSAAVINYPNEHPYTRVTEFKYLTGQRHPKSTLVSEHPRAEGDPYYPVPRPENVELFKRYKALGEQTPGVHFVGRLATYKYYNMDQVVAQALALFGRLTSGRTPAVSQRHTNEQIALGTSRHAAG